MISIVFCVYNGEKYLAEAIESVLDQTYTDFELIVINDGSTDNSLSIIHEYMKRDQRIRVYSTPNRGLAQARNLGVKKAGGEYVTFFDADDLMGCRMLETMHDMIESTKTSIAFVRFTVFRNQTINLQIPGDRNYIVRETEDALKDYFASRMGNVAAGLFKKELLTRFPPGMIYEDNIPKLKAILRAKRVSYCKTGLYFYRKNQHSITGQKITRKNFDILKIGYMQKRIMERQAPDLYRKIRNDHMQMISAMTGPKVRTLYDGKQWDELSRLYEMAPLGYIANVLTAYFLTEKDAKVLTMVFNVLSLRYGCYLLGRLKR
ncbi:MAG: glycosyltransferase [Lachnospiraceae bacterium]|nr:glycosyltransferase [Lachnospiraceae bacterium]